MRTMRMKRATMLTAIPAFAPVEIPLEPVEPVVFPGLNVDAKLDCVVGLEIPVGAARSLSSHITTIGAARSTCGAVSVDVGFTTELMGELVVLKYITLVTTAPEGMARLHISSNPAIEVEVPGLEGFSKAL